MSSRLGNPISQITAAAAGGGTAGRSMALNPSAGLNQWCEIISLLITYVTSSNSGSRSPIVEIKDVSGNILYVGWLGQSLTGANQTLFMVVGGGVALSNVTGPNVYYLPLPDGFCAPPGATVFVYDSQNTSVADTVAMNAVLSM